MNATRDDAGMTVSTEAPSTSNQQAFLASLDSMRD
jgi:hypothetical protein